MTLSCGLEVGPKVVKLALVEGGSRGVKLLDFAVKKVEVKKGEDAEAPLLAALKELLAERKIPLSNVVASVRAQDAALREIVVPFVRDEQIKKTVRFQAESHFHSTSIDDLIVEYLKFAETEGKSKLLIAGVKKDLLERKLRFFEECAIDPVAIDLDLAALYNCYGYAGVFDGKGLVLCVEIEHDTLKVALVDDRKLRLARAIRIRTEGRPRARGESARLPGEGGFANEITRMISDEGQIVPNAEEAATTTKQPTAAGEAPDAAPLGTESSARLPVVILVDDDEEAFNLEDSTISPEEREDYLERVFLEIDRTIGAVALKKPLDLICLSGASCGLAGIEESFQKRFETKVERVQLAERYGVAESEPGEGAPSVSLQGPTAIGLALKGLGIDAAGLDFRKDEFRFKGKYEMVKKGAACALCLVFALTFVFAFGLKQRLKERKRTLEGVRRVQEMLYGVMFPDLAANAQADHKQEIVAGRWYESLNAERQRLEQIYGGGSGGLAGGNTSALVILREFAEAKKRIGPQWGIEVTTVRVDPREGQQSLFVFNAPSDAAGIKLQKAFEESKVCEGSTQSSHQEKGKCRTEFVVKLRKTSEGS